MPQAQSMICYRLVILTVLWTTAVHGLSLGLFQTPILSVNSSFCIESVGCFDPLGSFPIFDPFVKRPISVNVSIFLITREEELDDPPQLNIDDANHIVNSSFNFSRDSKFIIPGWQSNRNSTWIREMAKELLLNDDYNVFVVSWADYLINVIYSIAAVDTRFVGDKVAHFIQQLQDNHKYSLSKIHLIGHSLGAHICGFAGSKLNSRIARITGLDPAGPLFDGRQPQYRLDPTDALFVDVIHSNAGSLFRNKHFGIMQPSGHVDFYPNGGLSQPGCTPIKDHLRSLLLSPSISKIKETMELIACNHRMAVDYFTESINSGCQFHSQKCHDFDAFLNARCDTCDDDDNDNDDDGGNCINMGFPARWQFPAVADQSFFLTTTQAKPYCTTMLETTPIETTPNTNISHSLNSIE